MNLHYQYHSPKINNIYSRENNDSTVSAPLFCYNRKSPYSNTSTSYSPYTTATNYNPAATFGGISLNKMATPSTTNPYSYYSPPPNYPHLSTAAPLSGYSPLTPVQLDQFQKFVKKRDKLVKQMKSHDKKTYLDGLNLLEESLFNSNVSPTCSDGLDLLA